MTELLMPSHVDRGEAKQSLICIDLTEDSKGPK